VYLYLLCFVMSVLCSCIVSFMYIYCYLSVLVQGLLQPSGNSTEVNNNNITDDYAVTVEDKQYE